jgi:DNA repair protein RadD
MSDTLELFKDQQEVMADLRSGMKRYKANLLQSPTGSGKTAMAMYMILKATQKLKSNDSPQDRKIIFTVPRKDLLEQTTKSFSRFGIEHSHIASGKPHNPFAPSFIGMIDTMANKIKTDDNGKIIQANLPPAYMVVIDEAHYGAAAMDKVISYYKQQGAWIVGLSATPWKLNGKGLVVGMIIWLLERQPDG